MCSGIEFHATGPACEKARSPNLVRSCGSEKSVDDVLMRDLTLILSLAILFQLGCCDSIHVVILSTHGTTYLRIVILVNRLSLTV